MHVIDSLALGGAERMLVEIANATTNRDFRVSVCVTRSVTTLARELRSDIRLHVLNRTGRYDLRAVHRLAAIVREDPVALFHVHGRPSFAFLSAASALGRIRGAILLHDHDGWIETTPTVPLWFRIVGRVKASCYVGVHERMHQWAEQAGIPEHRTRFISNALDLKRFTDDRPSLPPVDLGFGPDDLLGVWVGGIRRQKGLSRLIDALHGCPRPPFVRVMIVGAVNEQDYHEECLKKIAAHGLEDVFLFSGARTDIPALLKRADFALLSSESESGPLVLIEYLARGLPIVAVETGSVSHHAARSGVPGFVPPGDTAAYRAALEELLRLSPAERAARGALGIRVAREHFEIGAVMPSWYSAYRVALGERPD